MYRLEPEFRSLSDVSHPNVVSLDELVASDEGWFIATEATFVPVGGSDALLSVYTF